MTVFVTLAGGRVGTELMRQLSEQGIQARGGVRNVSRVHAMQPSADYVRFDYEDPTSFAGAFDGVDALFLASPREDFPNTYIQGAAESARAAGVRRVVLLSALGVDKMDASMPPRQLELYVEQSWPEWTILRPNSFMQNYATMFAASILHGDAIVEAAADATTAFIDIRDLAAVAVEALVKPGHHAKGYTLTGQSARHRNDVAAAIGAATGRDIRYIALDDDAFHAALIGQGMPGEYAHKLVELYRMTRSPLYNGVVTDDVHQILGRAPISLEQFARDYREAWLPAGQQA
ncbi:MAG: NAD(P)H-binding protein [Pleurocapsa minor GSE-CHR-MK-17-07R]|jgi:uncharacterized protein YbjT (DUF2867 family)|nr:NAD(P)H-binding protein [Pleurocapsa minor GSE-CHR-MK 17-07R]